jgi:hypothetical protein
MRGHGGLDRTTGPFRSPDSGRWGREGEPGPGEGVAGGGSLPAARECKPRVCSEFTLAWSLVGLGDRFLVPPCGAPGRRAP